MMVVALVFAILAPIMAQLLYFAISRRREYLADATAVRLTRYPEGLASALEKIANSTEDMPQINKAIAPLFIANPIKEKGRKLSDLTSTHPPISERIRILRAIAGGSGYLNYQEAFSQVKGKNAAILPKSAISETKAQPIRTASVDKTGAAGATPTKRDLSDLLRAANGFLFLTCACGLKIKVPPEYDKKLVTCPRCGTANQIPTAELTAAAAVLEGIGQQNAGGVGAVGAPAQLIFQRQSKGWESFKCSCGRTIQLSPAFDDDRIECPNCSKVTLVK
ncbi:MAG: M48 family metalloprotease, partial [Candidatus Zixiibacteriota bacterium]